MSDDAQWSLPPGHPKVITLYAGGVGNGRIHPVWTMHPDGRIEEGDGYSPELAVSIMVASGLARMEADSKRPAMARPQS